MKSFERLQLADKRVLFVASTGGHLAEAMKILEITGASPQSLVVTFPSPQSRGLTRYRMAYVPYVAPRDHRAIARAAPALRRIIRAEPFDAVVSTGAGIALAAFGVTPRRLRRIYVESFSRFDGPSTTGRIVRFMPGVETYTQHARWADDQWAYVGDVAPTRSSAAAPSAAGGPRGRCPRIFVTLGTIRPYRFDALLDRVRDRLPADCDVTWQVGCTTRTDLPGRVVEMLEAAEFEAAAESADVVVSHAGVGTAMALLEMGKYTVLVPRRAARNEHVDDHQVQICRELDARHLVVYREVENLVTADLLLGPTAA